MNQKNTPLIRLLILPALAISLTACPRLAEHAFSISVINNSPQLVTYTASLIYPDTTLPLDKNLLRGLPANDTVPYDSHAEWSNVLKGTPGGKISFFFLDLDTVNAYAWDKVRAGNKIIIRKDLTIEDLEKSGYKVTYP
jgi:hypothetical protein